MATAESDKTGLSSKGKYKVIGTRPIRPDGVDKVTGRARYGADIRLSGMLHGAILRSPYAHARIKSIDTSKAEQLEGVYAVITHKDFPDASDKIAELGEGSVNLKHLSSNVLADDKVLYKGHAVAAVAAETTHLAYEALDLIEVEYEPLTPVLDVRKAMQDDAPILHENQRMEDMSPDATTSDKPTNIYKKFFFEQGDPDAAFEKAHIVVEREFTTATVHQGYIEPHAATAVWSAEGKVTLYTCTQGTFTVRQQVAELLGLPLSYVKVIPTEIGGGFGGKIRVYIDPVAVALARKSGRPVKVVMDRASVFEATGPTPGSWIRMKLGVDAQGKIVAGDTEIAFESGAYPVSPIGAGCMCVFSCYDIPDGRIIGYDVCVNKPHSAAYRAPGSTQVAFATESVVDEICEKLGMDPIEFRLKNASVEGTRRVDGVAYPRIGLVETIEAIRDSEHYQTPLAGPNRGRGVASGYWMNAGLKSSVTATVNGDGKVSLVEGSTDIGGSRASIAMQFAETLGIPMEDVVPAVVDTDSVGYTDVTGGSRVTYATGWAAYEAALDVQRQLCDRAAEFWEVDSSEVTYDKEDAAVKGPDGKSFGFVELAEKVTQASEPVVGRGVSNHNEPGGAFGTHAVDVEVDPETGKVKILRYTAAQDVGTAIHPSYVEGQVQGGVVQGIGWALNEEYFYDEAGVMRNASYLDYRVPTCYDLPMIDPILVEVPNPGHPYGVRGVGEVPIAPPPAAIANAIYQAVGVRMRHLPMSPPHVLHEILKKEG
ncbi:MAG: xanthine dehydrogenase family protein molybdopterin-binding subunit [Planctomycetaceae bacterium]|nr:xanthine dehydrogenase family protein molybdopterin-binding subunit [Planctomycetaceae bacterium]